MRTNSGSRRRAFVALAAAIALPLAACGGDDDSASEQPSVTSDGGGSTEPAAPDTTGGPDTAGGPDTTSSPSANYDLDATVVVATAINAATLDPHKGATLGVPQLVWPIYDTLVRIEIDDSTSPSTFTTVPSLATSWDVSGDGTAITFELRDDVTFTDGTPFDADTVKVNLERAMNDPESAVVAQLASLDSIEVVDPTTVTIHLKKPDRSIFAPLSSTAGMMLNPKLIAAGTDFTEYADGAGTGPYIPTEVALGSKLTYARNDGYWDDAVLNHAPKTFVIDTTGDSASRLNALRSGSANIVFTSGFEQDAADLAESDSRFVNHVTTGLIQGMLIRSDDPSTNTAEVRRAVAMAIDPEVVAETVASAACTATRSLFSTDSPFYDPAVERIDYDPDGARQLLADAGLDSAEFNVVVTPGTLLETQAIAFQAQLAEAGITLKVEPAGGTGSGPAFLSGGYAAIMANWGTSFVDVHQALASRVFGWDLLSGAPEVAEQIADLDAQALDPTLSDDEVRSIYGEIDRILTSEAAVIIPTCASQVGFIADGSIAGLDANRLRKELGVDPRDIGVEAG